MYLVITASSDTYLTNKIVDQSFRATDANVGAASTLDLFKLYNETSITGSDGGNEISRILIKFNYDNIGALTSSRLNIDDASFNCRLRMYDINAGNPVPANFTAAIYPLSKSFQEGLGRDTLAFSDLYTSNFVTSSYKSGVTSLWNRPGAMASGTLGQENLDIFERGNLNDNLGIVDLYKKQLFTAGTEDLSIDITKIVSGSLSGQFKNHGFLIAFSGSDEVDIKTRFVKRFASRHVSNKLIVPRIEMSFDDTILDNTLNSFLNMTSSLYLRNSTRGTPTNIVSGSGLKEIGGPDCIKLKLKSGSYSLTVNASQVTQSSNMSGMPGLYKAQFCIPYDAANVISGSDTIYKFASKSGSIKFLTTWGSIDQTVGYLTSSILLTSPFTTSNSLSVDPDIRISNLKKEYREGEIHRVKLFCINANETNFRSVKRKITKSSLVFDEVYYRVREKNSGKIVIPFKKDNNGTRVSSDGTGMFFDFHFGCLNPRSLYSFEFFIKDGGIEKTIVDVNRFVVLGRK